MKKSQKSQAIPKDHVEKNAVEALNLWYPHLPVTFGKVKLETEQYKYIHTHPKWQKGLNLKYYWGHIMVSFEPEPTTWYELDFLMLEDGTVLPAKRSYHTELRYFDIRYADG